MRIIYIANARIPTEKAHGLQIMKMCGAFASLGPEVELLLPKRRNTMREDPFEYYKVERNFKITKLPCLDLIFLWRRIGNLGLWVESFTFSLFLLPYLLFKRADIFYARDKYSLPASILRKNFIMEMHVLPRNHFLYPLVFRKAQKIVVITNKIKEALVKRGIGQDKILVAPDAVDVKMFECSNVRMSSAREKLKLPQDKKIVLYTGHLYDWKGTSVLAEASQYLSDDTEVCFVGGTPEDIEKFKFKCSNVRNVRIVGHRPHKEIPLWLKAADILVLPNSAKENISKYWTSPLKMFEYMASKRPIVASDLPSIREVLNEKNALLTAPDNPQALAAGINKLLTDYDLAKDLAERAFQDVQSFTWEKRASRIIKGIMGSVYRG